MRLSIFSHVYRPLYFFCEMILSFAYCSIDKYRVNRHSKLWSTFYPQLNIYFYFYSVYSLYNFTHAYLSIPFGLIENSN